MDELGVIEQELQELQELQDLSGLLADLYHRVAVAAEPGLAGQVGHALNQAAQGFNALGAARG